MNIKDWGARVANWKRKSSAQKPLEWHIAHLHSEVSEVFEELRIIQNSGKLPKKLRGTSPFAVVRMGTKDGHPHPEGFGIELADVVLIACYLAAVTGVDLEQQMEIKMKANEQRRARS